MAAPLVLYGDFRDLPNLCSEKLGARAIETNDDFFAPKENLTKDSTPIFIPDKYVDTGKWMDGWESRRRREPGHDWCIVHLGFPGVLSGFNVDTAHFLGNYPEHCSIEGCLAEEKFNSSTAKWVEILPKSKLEGGKENLFPVKNPNVFSHLRLNIFPDGGVARLRVHGRAKPDWSKFLKESKPLNLAALELAAEVVTCNDMFFGNKDNLIQPGQSQSMADGWETKRKRVPGYDWTIIKLGHPGVLSRLEIDTHHYKGNFPESCSVEACTQTSATAEDFKSQKDMRWVEVLPRTKLKAHSAFVFEKELSSAVRSTVFTHLRLNIYPDGGIARLRAIGIAKPV